MTNSTKKIAVIQNGCAIFGLGNTREQAIEDSVQWLNPGTTIDDVNEMLNHGCGRNVYGKFYVTDDAEEISLYLKNV